MIPSSALASAAAIIGRTGSGKTFAAKSAVERELAAGARVCIIDPTGAWYGLRSKPDGSPSSFAPIIFGGDHADVPIDDTAGERLAVVIARGDVRASIIDLSEFTSGGTTRFLTDFMEELYRANRGPILLVMDEADVMAPQQPMPEQQRLKGAVNKIVRRGRIKGLRPLMITQRPAVIDKSVLSQISTLVAMRLTSPQDRKAVDEWVKGNADADQAREVLDSLPKLAVGEGWIWSPADDVLERVTFPPITTFDSSRAPEEGDVPARPSALADVDLRELRAAFEVPKGAGLRLGAEAEMTADTAAAAERRGYERGRDEGLGTGARRSIQALQRAESSLEGALVAVRAGLEAARAEPQSEATVVATPCQSEAATVSTAATQLTAAARPTRQLVADSGLNSAARKILAVLDTNPPVRRTWRQAATLAGIKATGGHFGAGRKGLREAGLIVEDGELIRVAKPSAAAAAPGSDPAALVEMWARVVSGAAPKLLNALFAAGGRAARTALAHELGMKPSGGHWNAGWKELRDNGIVTVEGDVAQLTELFRGE